MISNLRIPLLLLSGAIVTGFIAGIITLLRIPDNPCEMTYMFEHPQYIPVLVPESKTYRYKLYAYGEGRYAQALNRGQYHGIPVIFVPGSGGCFKQVRSLASVAYRMHEDHHKPNHFNFFTLDLSEELTGLYGGLLTPQTEFLGQAIRAVQRLYHRQEEFKVILIGHSMGGLVAKSVLTLPDFDTSLVDVVLTLSSPHLTPPFAVDPLQNNFYRRRSTGETCFNCSPRRGTRSYHQGPTTPKVHNICCLGNIQRADHGVGRMVWLNINGQISFIEIYGISVLASSNLTSGYIIRRLSLLDNHDMPALVGVNALSLRLSTKQCLVLSKWFDMRGRGEREREKERGRGREREKEREREGGGRGRATEIKGERSILDVKAVLTFDNKCWKYCEDTRLSSKMSERDWWKAHLHYYNKWCFQQGDDLFVNQLVGSGFIVNAVFIADGKYYHYYTWRDPWYHCYLAALQRDSGPGNRKNSRARKIKHVFSNDLALLKPQLSPHLASYISAGIFQYSQDFNLSSDTLRFILNHLGVWRNLREVKC
eukprot:sb/3463709/